MSKLSVPNMSCMHCVMKIEKALKDNKIVGKVDLKTKTVEVDKEKEAREVLAKIGYPVK